MAIPRIDLDEDAPENIARVIAGRPLRAKTATEVAIEQHVDEEAAQRRLFDLAKIKAIAQAIRHQPAAFLQIMDPDSLALLTELYPHPVYGVSDPEPGRVHLEGGFGGERALIVVRVLSAFPSPDDAASLFARDLAFRNPGRYPEPTLLYLVSLKGERTGPAGNPEGSKSVFWRPRLMHGTVGGRRDAIHYYYGTLQLEVSAAHFLRDFMSTFAMQLAAFMEYPPGFDFAETLDGMRERMLAPFLAEVAP